MKPKPITQRTNTTCQAGEPLSQPARRKALQTSGLLALGAGIGSLPALSVARVTSGSQLPLTPTPSGPVGPFYPEQFASIPTDSLVQAGELSGEAVLLSGRLTDPQGRPLHGMRIEIWQCDPLGRYHHSRDSAPDERDPGFLGFGWQTTDQQGRYRFTTLVPPPYPGRTPHIHLAIISNTTGAVTRRFATQIYLPDEDRRNRADSIYRSLGDEAVHSTATLADDNLRFDLVMGNQRW